MSTQRVYLVIDQNRNVRAAKRPRLGMNEIAIAVNLTFPNSWGHTVATVDVAVPDFTPTVEVDTEVGDDDA